MLIEEILKTEDFSGLKREINNFPKSLMLIGKDELYLKEFATMVSLLIMDGDVNLDSDNAKKVIAGTHPDLKIYPTKEKLLVADSEEIGDESFIKPIFADKKVFIINNIDGAMESAQNKLLKVLEEPSRNVYMILTCTNLNLVLPTIRSRCNKVELHRLSDECMEGVIGNIPNKELILACSDGQIGRAQSLAKKKDFEDLIEDCVSVFTKMKNSKQVLEFSKNLLSYKNDSGLILELFALLVEDLIKLKSGEGNLVRLTPLKSQLESVGEEYTIRALCEIAGLIDTVAKEKQFNVNFTIAIENLLLNILEVKYICR